MKLLLDTHALIWSICSSHKLPVSLAERLATPENQVLVSAVSFWEIAIKSALGKMVLENVTPDQLRLKALDTGYEVIPLDAEDAATFHALPRLEHKDPFDRMLVWQAIRGGYFLVSCDQGLMVYEAHGLKRMWV